MVLGFGGKDEKDENSESGQDQKPSLATEEVERLASKGYNEQEIINELRDMGFSNSDIKRSIDKVLKSKVTSSGGEERVSRGEFDEPERGFEEAPPRREEQFSDGQFIAPAPDEAREGLSDSFERGKQDDGSDTQYLEMTEEEEIDLEILIEEIVDEKWMSVKSDMEAFFEEEESLREDIERAIEKADEIKEKQNRVKRDLEGEIKDLSTRMDTIESRISSLEKAFKKSVPEFMEKSSGSSPGERQTVSKETEEPSSSIPDVSLESDIETSQEDEPSVLPD